ncbi:MAG: type II toxin-antitoxin system VapC family toxin [Elusimicrobia bacterium]|nr:type II toxin-antitoxin system VapC family toxin [Candidatus Liberimonas magnetica]
MKYVMDTHIWIWWHMKPEMLSKKTKEIISDTRGYEEMLVSAISIWEFCKLIQMERIVISCDTEEWIKKAIDMPKFRIVPLSTAISISSTTLPEGFHSDPADQIIVATAREENATILTSDKKIISYKHVKSVW